MLKNNWIKNVCVNGCVQNEDLILKTRINLLRSLSVECKLRTKLSKLAFFKGFRSLS